MSQTRITLGPIPHFKEDWATGKAYKKDAIVFHNGSSYKALVNAPSTEPSFNYNSSTGQYTVASGWGLLAVGAGAQTNSLLEELKTALGYASARNTITLTAGQTGKYVKRETRAAVANASFNISAPFSVSGSTELLIKTGFIPSDATHAALDLCVISIYEETERVRTVQKTNGSGAPLYYVVEIDPETGAEVVTTDETTVDTGYPVYTQETYTESRYVPISEDRLIAIPDSGYYVALIHQSCRCVVSYKPGITDLNIIAIKYGALANLTSQIFGTYERRALVESLAELDARVGGLEAKGDRLGAAVAGSIDSREYLKDLYPVIMRGAGAPAEAVVPDNLPEGLPWDGIPVFIGQEYLDTENKKVYKAFGVNAISDWVAIN